MTPMIRLMIGRDLKSLYTPPAAPPGEAVLELVGRPHRAPTRTSRSASSVRRGEILGLAGLVGSGRTELARAIFGIDRAAGRRDPARRASRSTIAPPRDAIDRGIYLVPEDRKRSGLLLDFSIAENISLPDLASYARAGIVDRGARRPQRRAAAAAARHPHARTSRPRSARCRAATSRRSCWPNGCR